MANKQTRAFRKMNVSTKVAKGVSVYVTKGSNAVESGALTFAKFDSTKGRCVDSHIEREHNGHKKWQGAGDALGRNREAAKNKG